MADTDDVQASGTPISAQSLQVLPIFFRVMHDLLVVSILKEYVIP